MGKEMTVSIVIPVLDSHEIVRRQLLHFDHMRLPTDVEVVLVDDGSDPPIVGDIPSVNFKLVKTNDKRRWTSCIARNRGIAVATGEFVIATDIDHIVTRELVDAVRAFDGDKMVFRRRFGILRLRAGATSVPDPCAVNSPELCSIFAD